MKLWEKIRRRFRREPSGTGAPSQGSGTAPTAHDATQTPSRPHEPSELSEKEFLAELFEIEAAIVSAYRDDHHLTDRQVDCALEAILDALRAQQIGRAPRRFNLTPPEQKVYDYVWEACEVLGGAPPRLQERLLNPFPLKKCTPEQIVTCVKWVRKFIRQGNKHGPQGYLDMVAQRFMRLYRTLERMEDK